MSTTNAEGLSAVMESSDSFDSGIKSFSRSPSLTSIDRWPIFFQSSRKVLRPERKLPKRKSLNIYKKCKIHLNLRITNIQNHSSQQYYKRNFNEFSRRK